MVNFHVSGPDKKEVQLLGWPSGYFVRDFFLVRSGLASKTLYLIFLRKCYSQMPMDVQALIKSGLVEQVIAPPSACQSQDLYCQLIFHQLNTLCNKDIRQTFSNFFGLTPLMTWPWVIQRGCLNLVGSSFSK